LEIRTKCNQKPEVAREFNVFLEKITHPACYLGLGRIYDLFPIMSNILSYQLFIESVKKGSKYTATGLLNKTFNQDYIKQKIESYEKEYLIKLVFQHCVSIFEFWFYDILKIILKDNENRINQKRKIDVSTILSAHSIEDLKNIIVETELNELTYKKLTEWIDYLAKFVNFDAPPEDEILKLIEIKASRDILVHNNGIINSIYIEKSGSLARGKDGEIIPVTPEYLNESLAIIKNIISNISNQLANKFSKT